MERLKELITQLKEQFDRKAEPSQMLETTRLLEAELRLLASQPPAGRVMPTKIAVMMPSSMKISGQRNGAPEVKKEPAAPITENPAPITAATPATAGTPASVTAGTPATAGVSAPATAGSPVSVISGAAAPVTTGAPAPVTASASTVSASAVSALSTAPAPAPAPIASPSPAMVSAAGPSVAIAAPSVSVSAITREKNPERGQWPFDPLAEKPTDRFTLSQRSREVNDVIGNNGTSSLNDKLKSDVVDLKSTLNDAPVRDLKKAIGVNDRYVFINQLFRGDEVMYERSLKTINGFRILPEAEYWMERELKVKLGWDENREATRHFYQLVKRRFS